jgi:hypothetical protein
MKRIYFFSLLFTVFIAAPAFAQLEKGTLVISGTSYDFSRALGNGSSGTSNDLVGFQYIDGDFSNQTILGIAPEIGYFVGKRVMIGGQVNLYHLDLVDATTSFEVAPLLRVYFNPNSKVANFYGQVQANFGVSSGDNENDVAFGGSLALGATTMLSPGIALNSALQFNVIADGDAFIGLNLGLQAFLKSSQRKEAKSASAGIHKGTVMLGTSNAIFSSTVDGDISSSILGLSPYMGYFFTPRFVGGLGMSMNNISSEGSHLSTYSFEPNLRYYFNKPSRLMWFAGLGYIRSIVNFDIESIPEFEYTANAFKFEAGFNLFLTRNIALEFALNPQVVSADENDLSIFGTRLGINYFIRANGGE